MKWYRNNKDLLALTCIAVILLIECVHRVVKYYRENGTRFFWNGYSSLKVMTSPPLIGGIGKTPADLEAQSPLSGKVTTGDHQERAKPKPASKKPDFSSVNTYDLFKLVATIGMFVDHYGYMGLPGASWEDRSWMRVIGRSAAPPFFFLSGYASKRFRMRTWIASLMIYASCLWVPIGIVHVPFESILCIAMINCVFEWLPPSKILKIHPILSVLAIAAFFFLDHFFNHTLGIAYGVVPFMLAIGGDLTRHESKMRYLWLGAAIAMFAFSSIRVFGKTQLMAYAIAAECLVNFAFMVFFRIVPIKSMDKLPFPLRGLIRDGIKWISRNGLVVYIGHLTLYRLVTLSMSRYAFYSN